MVLEIGLVAIAVKTYDVPEDTAKPSSTRIDQRLNMAAIVIGIFVYSGQNQSSDNKL